MLSEGLGTPQQLLKVSHLMDMDVFRGGASHYLPVSACLPACLSACLSQISNLYLVKTTFVLHRLIWNPITCMYRQYTNQVSTTVH